MRAVSHRLLWLAGLLTCATGLLATEVEIKGPTQVVPDAPFVLDIEVINPSANVQTLELPEVENVYLEYRRGIVGTSIVRDSRGNQRITSTVQVEGLTKRLGEHTIPPITVVLNDGKRIETEPYTIVAEKGDERLQGDLFAEVEFEPDRLVPGQPCIMNFHIYLHDDINLNYRELGIQPPDAAHAVTELERAERPVYDAEGKQWNRVSFRWRLVFLQPGSYEVGGQQTFYQSFGFRRRTINVPVAPDTVIVQEFPSDGRPDDFTGLLGPLAVEASLDRETVQLGEGTTLTLKVLGDQLGLLARPDDPTGRGYRLHYLDSETLGGDEEGAVEGRVFRWNVEPSAIGTIHLPSFTFTYFDPRDMTYRRASTEPLSCRVLAGRQHRLDIGGARLGDGSGDEAEEGARVPLPEPLRGAAGGLPWARIAGLALAGGLLLGLGIAGWHRQRAAGPRIDRRAQVRQAVAAEDWDEADRQLHAWLPELAAADRPAVERLIAAVEAARFGGQQVDPSLLEDLPADEGRRAPA